MVPHANEHDLPLVLVLMGGPDAEREVSLNSGTRVADGLRRSGRYRVNPQVIDRLDADGLARLAGDLVAPIVHGPWGEGGELQALLERDGRPYLGSGPEASRLAMNKVATKEMARRIGVPTPDWQLVTPGAKVTLPPPAVVKPVDDGSSVDLYLCDTIEAVETAAQGVASRRGAALVERLVKGREVTVGIVGGVTLPIIEIIPHQGTYDYEAKYIRSDTTYRVDPADMPAPVKLQASRDALAIAEALGCRDVSRVDFLVADGKAWLLEVNTMPGMTDHSLVPKAAAATGLDFPGLCCRLMGLAADRASASAVDGRNLRASRAGIR